MRFTKMHGAGNDYVYVNGFVESVAEPAALARKISDRHLGVGADGLILVLPSDAANVRMRMFNADGSEAEMCGNGVRCVAKFAHDRGLSAANPLRVETGAGVLTIQLTLDAAGKVSAATVDMGEPVLVPNRIPVTLPPSYSGLVKLVDAPLQQLMRINPQSPLGGPPGWMERCGLDARITCVSMGNPHVVLFCRDPAAVPLEQVGPAIEKLPLFPRKINVHFVSGKWGQTPFSQQQDAKKESVPVSELTMRTWERGSGLTLACGTGASAVCVAGVLTGRSARQVLIHLPGGDLNLEWRQTDNHVYMTGPAVEVFEGVWPG